MRFYFQATVARCSTNSAFLPSAVSLPAVSSFNVPISNVSIFPFVPERTISNAQFALKIQFVLKILPRRSCQFERAEKTGQN